MEVGIKKDNIGESKPITDKNDESNMQSLKNTLENGEILYSKYCSKVEVVKSWSVSKYKRTKQRINEILGYSLKTVDVELENEIIKLSETQKKYEIILKTAKNMAQHFQCFIQTQQLLGNTFAELSEKSPELEQEFVLNSETQINLSKNGQQLLKLIDKFVSSVNTLCYKTIEDTLITIRKYENARIEYDAFRSEFEVLDPMTNSNLASVFDVLQNYQIRKEEFEKIRSDIYIKLKYLNENRIKVMHNNLILFNNAIKSYFTIQ
ncbi:arfaptin-2-like [Daktulosphaira vitifoliae]|uniref:arfaptin-2-like n=1 Tax=Daktulosphaira vitifoliae TaxID=58002 RepID=UPI0021AA0C69|nr:arfaptin-2-like [Daktulosphaira vitifoliae]